MAENELYNDQLLIQAIARGDAEAYRLLFNQHYQALCYFAAAIVHDKAAAEDIVQDSFSKLWDKKGDFKTTTNIKAFLFITTKNACLNYLKSRHRQEAREKEFTDLLPNHSINEFTDFDPLLSETEIIQALHYEIEQLPMQCRTIFKMSYLEGKKNDEIAALLNISYNTVRSQKLRALKLIRTSLLKKNLWPGVYVYLALLRWFSGS